MMATCIIQPIDMVKVRLQLGATGGPVSDFMPNHAVAADIAEKSYPGYLIGVLPPA